MLTAQTWLRSKCTVDITDRLWVPMGSVAIESELALWVARARGALDHENGSLSDIETGTAVSSGQQALAFPLW